MRTRLLLAVLPALLLSPGAAGAACVARALCVEAHPVEPGRRVATLADVDPLGGGGGNGEGIVCVYLKTSGAPPPGWGGSADSDPPYIWQQTKAWGDRNQAHWDSRVCNPVCEAKDEMLGNLAGRCPTPGT